MAPFRVQDPTAAFPRKGEYVGREACAECHDIEAEAIGEGFHAEVPLSPALMGCETCHGPGSAHAKAEENDAALITYPPALGIEGQKRVCGRCHKPEVEDHRGDPSGFSFADRRCTDCHAVHEERPATPQPGLHFFTRVSAEVAAERTGAKRCLTCHPLRDQLLMQSVHHSLASEQSPEGCEDCHGPGSLHVASGGISRLITRPDQARDGINTCRSCHQQVDDQHFHWQEGDAPLLSQGMTCSSCHQVHVASGEQSKPVDTASGQEAVPTSPVSNRLCAKCHAPAFDVLRGTIHESLGGLSTPLQQGCGACHSGAAEHAASGGLPDLVQSLHGSSVATQQETCLPCHTRSVQHFDNGSHKRNQVACLACHSPAATKGTLREDSEKNCRTCHQAVAAQFRQPNAHPVGNGQMHCSDCHDAHAARPRFHDLQLTLRSCVECHREYRGPFVYAHQAGRRDGCVICHSPHGSSNRRMLHQATTQQNCLQCHGDFPAFHDQTMGSVFTNCLNCHTEVHGSNHSRFLFR
ncbi:MAG: cytochrome c3 family protein [Planctomycetota bacterium]|jgi:DmsE family decaheme c-type cytochrome